jgi:GMP synthase (glutamine-hydrolysing)
MMTLDVVLVLDFGGQYTHLIAKRVREFNVFSEIVAHDISSDNIGQLQKRFNVKGLILSGGPQSVFDPNSPKISMEILKFGLPVLGLCYGHQLIAFLMGGSVRKAKNREFGLTYVAVDKPDLILKDLSSQEKVWMSHSDVVDNVGDDFEVLAHSENCPVAAFRHKEHPVYGLQWHPEVVHTERGAEMLSNFLFEICHCRANWSMEDFIEKAIDESKRIIGGGKAIMALSGGIDSSTAVALVEKAIGQNLTAVFVDHGFMREGEPESVRQVFGRFNFHLVTVDAKRKFLSKLHGVVDPEQKRKIIGEEFIRVFEEEAKKVGADYLIQGTIYPDRIESGYRKFSDKIKTHHNVAGLPVNMEFKAIVEPLRELYKDEVRDVAEKLGLPEKMVKRQPFPGPGLAVRVLGELTPAKVAIARKADAIVRDEVEKRGLEKDLWQYFAVLTDSKSTGVKGDARAYGYVVAVRIVESREAMTAGFYKMPYEVLERIASRVTNEIPEVTRVVYDLTSKPPATIEWE